MLKYVIMIQEIMRLVRDVVKGFLREIQLVFEGVFTLFS